MSKTAQLQEKRTTKSGCIFHESMVSFDIAFGNSKRGSFSIFQWLFYLDDSNSLHEKNGVSPNHQIKTGGFGFQIYTLYIMTSIFEGEPPQKK